MTSTMLDVNLDRANPLTLHDQVAAQIRRAIAEERGTVLRQVRQLAHFGSQQGYGREEVIQMIRDLPG